MTKLISQNPRSALFVLAFAVLPACGGSEPPPAAPPPAAPPVAAAPAPAPAPEPAPAPAPVAEAAPAPAPKHHGHGMEGMIIATLDTLDLKPEQKTAVDGIQGDLEKLGEATKEPRAKLENDVADGAAAGKIDHKKTDADIKELVTAVTATEPTMQDAMNRLYKTLDADQRKKLVETMREKGKEMHEHMGHEHEGKGPDAKGPGMGEGPMAKLGDELALTPEQKEKIKAKIEPQMKAHHAAMKEKMEAAEKHMDAIGTAFEGDKFDAKKAGVGGQAPEMVKAMATHRIQMAETLLSVLTPDQRAKFAAHLKEHAQDTEEETD
ncbi:MAG TPA: Spy/CpxP family protein refolding chaperone [Polyangiaceae bacterium]|jgi:Spy/CpxP family protein refolding chaperone|nr:Spy/CpxP family protein refolding chaperone [Polyangiaceae bacterium]